MSEPACFTLPLQAYPGMSRFILDWMASSPAATAFLPRDVRPLAPNGTTRGHDALVEALIASNARWGLDVAAGLRRWNAGETVTLIAGQQVGFAGGPLYTLTKLATLLALKRDLASRGVLATAFFWMATEDHDFAEAATLSLAAAPGSGLPPQQPRPQLDLVRLRATRSLDAKTAIGGLPIPESLTDSLIDLLGISRPSWLREGIWFRDSFAELLHTVTGNEIVLVDSLLPMLRYAGASLFRTLFESWEDVQQTLRERSLELERAEYVPQVVPRDGEPYTLLFRLDPANEREAIQLTGGGWTAGRRKAVLEDMLARPDRISTSALTRPLLQDSVLRPDVFVGGPAEVSYYAQIAPLHERLGIALPRVALRGHALVAPKRIARAITRYQLDPAAIFASADEVLADLEPQGVAEVRAASDHGKRALMEAIERISELALPADHALARAISRSVGHLEYHFDKLTERAIRGLVRKERDRWQAVRDLVATLYPDRHVQDRVAAWLPLWYLYGNDLLARLVAEIEPDAPSFKIIAL